MKSLLTIRKKRFFLAILTFLVLLNSILLRDALLSDLAKEEQTLKEFSVLLQQRIDNIRFITAHIYKNIATRMDTTQEHMPVPEETPLYNAITTLQAPDTKDKATDVLFFDSHSPSTTQIITRIAAYLDGLWGATAQPYSMYYLNGKDNSLSLISTLPLKKLFTRYQENFVSYNTGTRRAEMLQQANEIELRETFTALRKVRFLDEPFFTLQTTFNQPGHLATIIAFDIPVSDLLPAQLTVASLQIAPLNILTAPPQTAQTSLAGDHIVLTQPLKNAALQLHYTLPLMPLLSRLPLRHSSIIPVNLLFIFGFLGAYGWLRRRLVSQAAETRENEKLKRLELINEEALSSLPMGVLFYDAHNKKPITGNTMAWELLPYLSIETLTNLMEGSQDIVQESIKDDIYEIRKKPSQLAPEAVLLLISNQNKELWVTQNLQLARLEFKKNERARHNLFTHLGNALYQPLKATEQLALHSHDQQNGQLILQQTARLSQLIEEIFLLNKLEAKEWLVQSQPFSVSALADELISEFLPAALRKGLKLVSRIQLPLDEQRQGDARTLKKILSILLHYAITASAIGKVSLRFSCAPEDNTQLFIQLTDNSEGLDKDELENDIYPWISEPPKDRYSQVSGLSFNLCRQLTLYCDGRFTIESKRNIGTCYKLYFPFAPLENNAPQEEQEPLLNEMAVQLAITSSEIREIVSWQLKNWGATIKESETENVECDIFITDDQQQRSRPGIIVSDQVTALQDLGNQTFIANYNLYQQMLEACLLCVEQRYACETLAPAERAATEEVDENFRNSDYYSTFAETVPVDIDRLYTSLEERHYASLKETAHRLKGVFAMLELGPGNHLCEQLEAFVEKCDDLNIKNYINKVDSYVSKLLS